MEPRKKPLVSKKEKTRLKLPANLPFSSLSCVAIEAALESGQLLLEGFGSKFAISSKEGIHNLVTEYDHLAERKILSILQRKSPPCRFLAEESGDVGDPTASLLWIVDPLDGTVNFAHQIPVFAVSIAAYQYGSVICGVIYQPITGELFVAEKGIGAFFYSNLLNNLSGHRLSVSSVDQLERSFLATGFPYNLAEDPHQCIEHFLHFLRIGVPNRRLGAAAIDLAYTAAGRFDGFFEVSLAPWDCAAGMLLIEEAGGKVSHWGEEPFDLFSYGPILATNQRIHTAMSSLLSRSP